MYETEMANIVRPPRREFFRKVFTAGVLLTAGIQALTGCGKEKSVTSENESTPEKPATSCDDLTGVSDDHLAIRKKLGYVEKSPIADNQCHNCNLYLPPKEGHACGGCMLFKGPVFADAYCTYWAPKV